MTIITVANQKGGVGKTTTAVTLAHGLAIKGKRVLLIDLDPQGNVAITLGKSAAPGIYDWLADNCLLSEIGLPLRDNLTVIPGDKSTEKVQNAIHTLDRPMDYLTKALRSVKGKFDHIVFDTSPSVGGLQERALFAADLVIIPAAVDFLSAEAVAQTMATMHENAKRGATSTALILPTFLDATRESAQILSELRALYGDQVLDPIHKATVMRECTAEGVTIWERDGRSRAAAEYSAVLYKVLEV